MNRDEVEMIDDVALIESLSKHSELSFRNRLVKKFQN
jgi:hypothetical protein